MDRPDNSILWSHVEAWGNFLALQDTQSKDGYGEGIGYWKMSQRK